MTWADKPTTIYQLFDPNSGNWLLVELSLRRPTTLGMLAPEVKTMETSRIAFREPGFLGCWQDSGVEMVQGSWVETLVKFRDFHDFTWLDITSTQKPFSIAVLLHASLCFEGWLRCGKANSWSTSGLLMEAGGNRRKLDSKWVPKDPLWWSNGRILFPTFSDKTTETEQMLLLRPISWCF